MADAGPDNCGVLDDPFVSWGIISIHAEVVGIFNLRLRAEADCLCLCDCEVTWLLLRHGEQGSVAPEVYVERMPTAASIAHMDDSVEA